MKSTLKFDLGSSNEPIINIRAVYSEDLRDTVAMKLLNSLWGNWEEPGNEQSQSRLFFAECVGAIPDGQDWQLTPIHPGDENRFINRLQPSQALRIIPLAFQMFDGSDRRKILEQLTELDRQHLAAEKGKPKDPTNKIRTRK